MLTRGQRNRLAASGVKLRLKRTQGGQTVRQRAAAQAAAATPSGARGTSPAASATSCTRSRETTRSSSSSRCSATPPGPRDPRAEGHEERAQRRRTARGRRLSTARPSTRASGSAPRSIGALLHYFIDSATRNDPDDQRPAQAHASCGSCLVANPDGYQYTFDHERLWRKNLRDNNGDGQITGGDGVDPNRNFNEHWNYDNEGSSTITSSDTYRGTAAASEPETQAMHGCIDRIKPKLHVNFHSFGPLILYPQGWQVGTPDADNPIYAALGGTDANPAIAGFDPGLSADELYVTNGETTDYADIDAGTISFTPELEEGCPGCGFVFPDDEALVQAEFEKTLPFDLSLARSADNPCEPGLARGTTTKPFYLEPERGRP